jgi:hypothetical protein
LKQENELELPREIRLRSNVAVITTGNPPERSKSHILTADLEGFGGPT